MHRNNRTPARLSKKVQIIMLSHCQFQKLKFMTRAFKKHILNFIWELRPIFVAVEIKTCQI